MGTYLDTYFRTIFGKNPSRRCIGLVASMDTLTTPKITLTCTQISEISVFLVIFELIFTNISGPSTPKTDI